MLGEYQPTQYRPAVDFLEYIERQQPATMNGRNGFDVSKGRIPEVDSVLSFVAAGGLTTTDVNDSSVRHYAAPALRTARARRTSGAFDTFVHIGYIYGQSYGQYTRLTYRSIGDGILVCLSDYHRLTFRRRGGRLSLTRLDYIMNETE